MVTDVQSPGLADLKIVGASRNTFNLTVRPGTTVQDLLEPYFWTNMAKRLTKHDLVDVTAEDDSLDATIRIVDVEREGNSHAKVRIIRLWQDGEGA